MSSDLHALKFSVLNMAGNGKKSPHLVEKTPAGNVRWVWNYFSSFKFHLLDSYEFLNFRLWFNQIFWAFFCDYGKIVKLHDRGKAKMISFLLALKRKSSWFVSQFFLSPTHLWHRNLGQWSRICLKSSFEWVTFWWSRGTGV